MIKLDENKLKIFLSERKKVLEKPKYSGVDEVVAGISLAVTLCVSDFTNITIINPVFFQIGIWIFVFVLLIYGIKSIISSIVSFYSIEQLYNEIIELNEDKKHIFNIVLLKSSDQKGKYLLFYSPSWKCRLFPNYKSLSDNYEVTNEMKNIRNHLKVDLNINVSERSIEYLGQLLDNKYSYNDKVNKEYIFHFYCVNTKLHRKLNKKSFRYNGQKYYWMTLNKMYENKDIVKKNKAVLDYVRSKTTFS